MKKLLLIASSAAVLSAGAAFAQSPDVDLRLTDVNAGPQPHRDFNDISSCLLPSALGLAGCFDEVSVDKPFADLDGDGTPDAAVIAIERFVDDQDHPIEGLFEVEIFDPAGSGTFGNALINVTMSGSSLPSFSRDIDGFEEIIRPGTDQVFSIDEAPVGGVVPSAGDISFQVVVEANTQVAAADNTLGFALPISMAACGDLTLSGTITTDIPGGGANVRPFSQTIATCDGSIAPKVLPGTAKIDFEADFKDFSVVNAQGVHEPAEDDTVVIGEIGLTTIANMVDLQAAKGDPDSVFNIGADVEEVIIEMTFESLIGIKQIMLGDITHVPTVDEYLSGVVEFVLSPDDLRTLFDGSLFTGALVEKGEMRMGTVPVSLMAFPESARTGPKTTLDAKGDPVPTGIGEIEHQDVTITSLVVDFTPEKEVGKVSFGETKFDPARGNLITPAAPVLLGSLISTGQIFGPFDWVGDPTMSTGQVFRVSHVPRANAHGAPIQPLKYNLELKAPTNGSAFEGVFKCEAMRGLEADGRLQKEVVLTSDALAQCLADNGAGSGNWGRADVTFTFVLNGETDGGEPVKNLIDVDRLMFDRMSGVVTSYGDNGNDAFSLKARSCDEGRFGPHTDNKLLADAREGLEFLCSANAITEALGGGN